VIFFFLKKKMKFFAAVAVAVLMMSAVTMAWRNNGDKVGVKVVVSQKALTYLKDQMIPAAEAAALASQIGDMHATASVPVVGDVDIDISEIKLNTLNVVNSSILLNSGNQIQVSITGLNMDMTMHWHYRECPWPHISDSGDGEGSTSHSSGTVGVLLGTDATGRPTAKINQCDLDLSDLDISLSGGASWLYNVIISLFHGSIVSGLENAVCSALLGDVQQQLDMLLATIPVQEPVGKYLAIDYSLAVNGGFVITPDQLLIASSSGEFYPQGSQPGKAPGSPVKMPDTIADKHFQIFASAFSAESLGYAAVTAGICQMLVTKDQAPVLAQAFFTTDFYSTCAPGLIDKYGSGKDVALFIALHSQPSIKFSQADGVIVSAGIEMTIRGPTASGDWEDAFTILLTTNADAVAKVNDTVISGQLLNANATASLVSTHVGDVDVNGFNDLINFALTMSMDTVNALLANGAALPSMQGLSFVDPAILYRDGYIAVITDVNFVPPPF